MKRVLKYVGDDGTELKAVWAYLQTVPAVEKGNR